MNPQTAYNRLNKLLWRGRLPKALVEFIDDDIMPTNFGITMWDSDFVLPIIFINASRKRWLPVLIHECIHISEPEIPHGKLFFSLVKFYVRAARKYPKELKGL